VYHKVSLGTHKSKAVFQEMKYSLHNEGAAVKFPGSHPKISHRIIQNVSFVFGLWRTWHDHVIF